MTLERVWALAILVAIPILWSLHRRRAPRVVRVASLVPFRAGEGGPPPSAARRGIDPVLALLVVAAAALALGAAGPRLGRASDSVRIVVDPSPSMGAFAEEPPNSTVSAVAEHRARTRIAAAAPGASVSLGPATDDADTALAAARADGFPGVVFVTDRTPDRVARGVVVVGPASRARGNVAITDVALDGDAALVSVENFGAHARHVVVRAMADDGRETGAAPADVAPRSRATVRLAAPPRDGPPWSIQFRADEEDALRGDDEVRVARRGGARYVAVTPGAAHVAAALRALGVTTRDADAADAFVRVGGALGDAVRPAVHFTPAASSGSGAVRTVPGSRTVGASTLARRGAWAFPLPAPSTRLAASCRLQGGETLVEDEEGALVVRDGTLVVIALDPEDASSDWARDGSFVSALGAALDLVTDGPDRLVVERAFPPGESDVAHEVLPVPSADDLRRVVRHDFAGTDLAPVLCGVAAVAAALAAWLGRRR